jgi:hypothetical protein
MLWCCVSYSLHASISTDPAGAAKPHFPAPVRWPLSVATRVPLPPLPPPLPHPPAHCSRDDSDSPAGGAPVPVTLTYTEVFLHHLLSLRLSGVDPTACGHYFALVAVLVHCRTAGARPAPEARGRSKTSDAEGGTSAGGGESDRVDVPPTGGRGPGPRGGARGPVVAGVGAGTEAQRKSAGTSGDAGLGLDVAWKLQEDEPLVCCGAGRGWAGLGGGAGRGV